MKKIQISASILSCDFGNLAQEIKKSEAAGVGYFHLDIMDGHFVPNISFGPPIVKKVRTLAKINLDAHLMIDNPWLYIEDFAKAGADIITLHVESYDVKQHDVNTIKTTPRTATRIKREDLKRDIAKIRSLGKKVGLALNPGTSAVLLEDFLGEIDLVLVMSVNPGFSGQKFIESALPKIKQIRSKFKGLIKVDGGINAETAPKVIAAGADILVSASYLYGSKDYAAVVKELKGERP
ncbi:MAG: ribulose-phosphate 3-epimerase [Candidatus Margulisbacteria bacterium]|nr:ribulose-phosphate 3-epimerase [Candidatus Margulisiibacteriota bacterium]MBU1021353.1 ribulose-phosphate 3-epimerase [Candidatus Margulisiibacteriota bacterium]MBU1729158.1 ribulose-phosphate 3-epimerase [Candidatus Margulisiibacteriota bacterium]MBU1954831.1 ribulose-phosphate 3-epimerase [Candidatus Margulisiibacteriota bacterium]